MNYNNTEEEENDKYNIKINDKDFQKIFNNKEECDIIEKDIISILLIDKETELINNNLYQNQTIYMALLNLFFGFIIHIIKLPFKIYCRHILKLNPSYLQYITAIATIPEILQIIIGIFSDIFPIFGKNRISYIILGNLLYSITLIWIICINNKTWIVLLYFLNSLGVIIMDVSIDSLLTELMIYEKTKGTIKTIASSMHSLGSTFSSIILCIILKDNDNIIYIFYIVGILSFFFNIIPLFFLKENYKYNPDIKFINKIKYKF